ncbi:MAG: hypothetical protein IPN71_14470 [Fibrobacteres bacterium]|jgi:hypothetical protein|nr:hypothetical protein [Fibrobacterota bacterium]
MKTKTTLVGLTAAALLWSCDDSSVESPVEDHEHESITTVQLKLANRALASDTLTLTFLDADGNGGAKPLQPALGRLKSGAVYDATVRFLDQSNPSDIHDLNEEIGGSESDDHRIFWTTGSKLNASVVDLDSKGFLLGLRATLTTLATGTDSLRINLRHLPGIKTATSKITDGETDADVAFPLEVTAP